jgi:hypothetical protein
MTHDETVERYFARASGAVGYDVLDSEGEVVASAADGWEAAAIVDLLNEQASSPHCVPEPA